MVVQLNLRCFVVLGVMLGGMLGVSCSVHADSVSTVVPLKASMSLNVGSSVLAEASRVDVAPQNQRGGAPQRLLTASEVVQTTLSDNLAMRSSVSNFLLQAQRLSRVARAEFNPKLSVSANSTRSGSPLSDRTMQYSTQALSALDLNWRLRSGANVKVSNGFARNDYPGQTASNSQQLSIVVNQPLLRGAGRTVTEANLAGAESAYRVAVKSLGKTAQALLAQALAAYIAVQQAHEAIKQAQVAHQLAQRVHELNIALVNAGRSPQNTVLQSQSDIAAASLGIAQAQNTHRQAVRTLAQAMGRSNLFDGVELVLTDSLERVQDAAFDESSVVSQALDASLELFTAHETVKQAELGLAIADNNLLPSLALSAGSSAALANTASYTGVGNRNHTVGLSLEYNFDRAPFQTEKNTALVNLDIARAQFQEVEQRMRDTAVDALRNLSFARSQQGLAQDALNLANLQLEAQVTRQGLGRASQLELSNAQQSLAAANRQLQEAARQVFRARIELAQIDGSLLYKWGAHNVLSEWLAKAQQELTP